MPLLSVKHLLMGSIKMYFFFSNLSFYIWKWAGIGTNLTFCFLSLQKPLLFVFLLFNHPSLFFHCSLRLINLKPLFLLVGLFVPHFLCLLWLISPPLIALPSSLVWLTKPDASIIGPVSNDHLQESYMAIKLQDWDTFHLWLASLFWKLVTFLHVLDSWCQAWKSAPSSKE